MSDGLDRFRTAMAKHLGRVMTPEVAAEIEGYAFRYHDESIDPARFVPHEYRSVVFQVESFRLIRDELHLQHLAHFLETERARDGQLMKPDYGYMAVKESRGELLQFTARMDRALVGNLRLYLFDDLHTGTRGATEDTLYLSPRARIGFTASRFIDYAERCLAEVGVEDVWIDTKILHDAAGNVIRDVGVLMKRQGYAHVAQKFHKRLKKE